MNLGDGSHVRKSNSGANASYAQESDSNVTHILPLMTQPFNFRYGYSTFLTKIMPSSVPFYSLPRSSRTLLPHWEELIIFNEKFSYLRHRLGDSLGIFFLVQVSLNRLPIICATLLLLRQSPTQSSL